MMPTLLLYEVLQAELRERLNHGELIRLSRTATRQHSKGRMAVLFALSRVLIAAGQRIQTRPLSQSSWGQKFCVPCGC